MRNGVRLCLAVLALAGVGLRPALAQDLAPVIGPLAPKVALGTSGAWSVLAEHGRLVLSDSDDAGAIRTYSIGWQGEREAGRSVGVRVQATGMDGAAAGLIFRVRSGFPRWTALALLPDRSIAVFSRTATGLEQTSRVPIPGGPHPEGELLQVSEHGGVTTLLANGVALAQMPDAAADEGAVGILAIGPGRFALRDFGFGPAAVPAGAGDDRVPVQASASAGDDRIPAPAGDAPAPAATPVAAGGPRWPVPELDPLGANVLGATMGVLAHEFGHFMIGELKLPATGPEEDVADEFAAMVFVDNMRDLPDQAGSMALAMAKFWWYTAEDHGDANQPDWFDEHAPDRARFGRIMCMLYGAAPRNFEPVMEQTGIPERTRARCIDDERKRHAAWDTLLRGHRRRGVDPVMPGDLDPTTPGRHVRVTIEPPKNAEWVPLQIFLQSSRMLDTAGALLSRLYVLPRDTQLVVRECGEANAFYNAKDGSVTLCYDMVAWILATFDKHEGTSDPQPPATPVATPPAAAFDIAGFLAGSWRLQTTGDQGVTDDILVQASADGTYRARHDIRLASGHVFVAVVGSWSAAATAAAQRYDLVLTPEQWSPKQICNKDGGCSPLNLDATKVTVEIKDRNTLASDQGEVTRVQ